MPAGLREPIGATTHYVTADLDEGPITVQEVVRMDHALGFEEMVARRP